MIQPRPYQNEAVNAILSNYGKGITRQLISLPTGCHAKGTPILMYDGSLKNVEDIVVGDRLMGPDSAPRTVLSLIHGTEEMYKISPCSGEPFIVNGNHLLSIKIKNMVDGIIGWNTVTISVNEFLKKRDRFKKRAKLYSNPIDFDSKPVELDPYFLGVILGNGFVSTIKKSVRITEHFQAVLDACQDVAGKLGLKLHTKQSDEYVFEFENSDNDPNKLVSNLYKFGLNLNPLFLRKRFVPFEYKVNSRDVRLNLLAGFLDTRGCLTNQGYGFLCNCVSKQLSDDIIFIARSLGLKAHYIKPYNKSYKFTISGNIGIIPNRASKKQLKYVKQEEATDKVTSVSTGFDITSAGDGHYYGFTVDKDNLYVMGNFIVTHNCGKTICFGMLIKELNRKTLIIAHREELLSQAVQKIKLVYPEADIGIFQADNKDGLDKDICVASVQTAWRHTDELKEKGYEVCICDEAHHAVSPSYMRIFNDLGFMDGNPNKLLLGVTATAFRADNVALKNVFEKISYERSILTMMRAGYLCEVQGVQIKTKTDISKVHTKNGDFSTKELSKAIDTPERNALVVDAYKKYGENRHGVVFASRVIHALNLAQAFKNDGISCEAIYGSMPEDKRKKILNEYNRGDIKILTNVGVLTEGWDSPDTDIIMMARPTKSKGLYAQIVGRGLRKAPNKTDCLILDFVDITSKHKVCNMSTLAGRNEFKLASDRKQRLLDIISATDVVTVPNPYTFEKKDIDLMNRSTFKWVQVQENQYKLNLMNGETLWCVPYNNGYKPVLCSKKGMFTDSYIIDKEPLPLGYAMGVCEDYARKRSLAVKILLKSAKWRGQMATEKQLNLLEKLGVKHDENITKGEASNLIDIALSNAHATDSQIWFIRHYNLHDNPESLSKVNASILISQYKLEHSGKAEDSHGMLV